MKNILLILIAILFVACTPSSKEDSQQTENTTEETTTKNLDQVISDYMKLKESFVNSDSSNAQEAAKSFADQLVAANMSKSMISVARKISETSDIKTQRAAFKEVTDLLIPVIKSSGKSMTVYVQYCPMAFNNKGANWLSLNSEIRNPYYGDMMLNCGKVQEEL